MGDRIPANDGPGRNRAIFVDRDGTLNPDLHYLGEPDRLELYRGVGHGLWLARAHGYRVICITNQSGIERGLYTEDQVKAIHARLNELLAREGTQVDAFYYCPHAPEHGCDCRKPRTKLFEDAARDWRIDLPGSAVIGDRSIDVEAGQSLGLMTAIVVPPAHEKAVRDELRANGTVPDILAHSFEGAIVRVLARG